MPIKKLKQSTTIPPLPHLRIRRSNVAKKENPCFVLMSSVLNCWAANGEGSEVCKGFEQDLGKCMEALQPTTVAKLTINYHSARLYPKMKGSVKD